MKIEPGLSAPVSITSDGNMSISAVTSSANDGTSQNAMVALIDQKLKRELQKSSNFYVNNAPESASDRQKRLFVWQKIIISLAHHTYLYKDLRIGDCRSVYYRANIMAQKSNHERVAELIPKLFLNPKRERVGFQNWFNDMMHIFHELEMMEAKFPVLVQIAIICKGLSSDHRYKDDTKDILSKGYDNISEVSALLAKRAIELNNVSSSFKPQEANYNSSVANKQKANKSNKPKACWWHALGICEYGEKCRMRHKGVQRSQVPENWLKNNSKRIEALQKQKPNKTDSWHDSNTNVPDKGKSEQKRSDKDKNKSKICFIFEQNGSCPKGDKCRYSHETTQEEEDSTLLEKMCRT